MEDCQFIRNFAIIAHVDHGKSTLADRLLEITNTVEKRLMRNQFLDSHPIERERGITIKLAPVRMKYHFQGHDYILNLIDTPGHVDFSYEVSRSLSACEGVILLVDATQGVQSQTLAYLKLAKEANLKIIPVINKIDLLGTKMAETENFFCEILGFRKEEIIYTSAKNGTNIDKLIEAIIKRIPPPASFFPTENRALVFSSMYDPHKGVVIYVRVFGKAIKKQPLKFFASKAVFTPTEIGFFNPKMVPAPCLLNGDVGYVATGLKDLSLAKVGDTIGEADKDFRPFPGFREPKPMVFLSFYPVQGDDFLLLRKSLEKLHLSDSSFTYTFCASSALGKGYLCGFLGLLHAEIVKERLMWEFGVEIIATTPSVEYRVILKNGKIQRITSPLDFPDSTLIKEVQEPIMYVNIYAPKETVGPIMQLCQERRGELVNLEYFGHQAVFIYLLPLSEIILDFFDRLKAISSGFASLDYEFYEYRKVNVVKLDVYLNKEKIEAFSQVVNANKARKIAENLVQKLAKYLPRHQFEIPIQAAIGGKIIARADIKAYRKDVTQKLYGGDRTRKDKLLEAQKEGKKRMRYFGKVSVPQEVFLKIFETEN